MQTDIAKKQHKGLKKVYEFGKKEDGKRISKKQHYKGIINQI